MVQTVRRWGPWMAVGMVAVTALTACGGSAGVGSGPLGNVLTGVAVDGYLQGATVFLDVNHNGMQDPSEPFTGTDLSGRYVLDYSSVTGAITGLSVVVTGGVDSDTGFAFTGRLSAPVEVAKQAQVVTPLTTLVDTMVAQGVAADVGSAKQKVASALGLTTQQLSTDPVAVLVNQPALYATNVALQRAVQLLTTANARNGESSHQSHMRVLQALAVAVHKQTRTVSVGELVGQTQLNQTQLAQTLASTVDSGVRTGLSTSGHAGAQTVLRAMDEVRTRMQSDRHDSLEQAANQLDTERGLTTSRPYFQLTKNSTSADVIKKMQDIKRSSNTTRTQPINTTGRLLASNCFQCHGTGGVGGFESIRGSEASEVLEYLTHPASSSIMAAHAQGYTRAQLSAIIAYLQQ